MPTSFGHYYRRFFSALVKDILQLWRAQVIGVILAFLITLLQIHFGVIPRALTAKALMSVGWPYAALALFFFALSTVRTPMLLDRKREKEIEEQRESQTSEIEKSRTQIASLQGILKRDEERQSKKFSFWLEAKKSEPSREHRFKYSEHGEEKTTDAVIPFIRLLVWNEGTVPLTMSGYVCWCGEDQANPVKTIDHHWVVRPGASPSVFEAASEILQAISGHPPFDWSKVQGDHAISFAIEYQDGGETKRSDPRKQYVRIYSHGTRTLESEVSSFPFST